MASGALPPRGLTIAELMVWTLCLSMHTLVHAEGMLQQYAVRDPYRLMMRNVHHLLNGYGWRPLFDPDDEATLDAFIARICAEAFHDSCVLRDDAPRINQSQVLSSRVVSL